MLKRLLALQIIFHLHYVKSGRIRSFSGPYSAQMREDTDQKNIQTFHAVLPILLFNLLTYNGNSSSFICCSNRIQVKTHIFLISHEQHYLIPTYKVTVET